MTGRQRKTFPLFCEKKSDFCVSSEKLSYICNVEKLGKQIGLLLQENDCVVLPGFGGFLIRPVGAHYADDEHLFLPPSRTVAFNSRLTENDGLLANRYMHDFQIGYNDAYRLVEKDIERLADTLATEGTASLPGVGVLQQDIQSAIHFTADNKGLEMPSLCGLDAIGIQTLSALSDNRKHVGAETSKPVITTTPKSIDIHIGKRFVHAISSAAAAALLLVLFALPMSRDQQPNVAGLNIASNSAKATAETTLVAETPSASESRSIYPFEAVITSKTESETISANESAVPQSTEATTPSESVAESGEKPYHIIIASLPNERNADLLVKKYTNKGFPETRILRVDNYVRISLASFAEKEDAVQRLREIRSDETYKHAWVFTEKKQ